MLLLGLVPAQRWEHGLQNLYAKWAVVPPCLHSLLPVLCCVLKGLASDDCHLGSLLSGFQSGLPVGGADRYWKEEGDRKIGLCCPYSFLALTTQPHRATPPPWSPSSLAPVTLLSSHLPLALVSLCRESLRASASCLSPFSPAGPSANNLLIQVLLSGLNTVSSRSLCLIQWLCGTKIAEFALCHHSGSLEPSGTEQCLPCIIMKQSIGL